MEIGRGSESGTSTYKFSRSVPRNSVLSWGTSARRLLSTSNPMSLML